MSDVRKVRSGPKISVRMLTLGQEVTRLPDCQRAWVRELETMSSYKGMRTSILCPKNKSTAESRALIRKLHNSRPRKRM